MAEGVGFEPTRRLPAYTLSRRADSAKLSHPSRASPHYNISRGVTIRDDGRRRPLTDECNRIMNLGGITPTGMMPPGATRERRALGGPGGRLEDRPLGIDRREVGAKLARRVEIRLHVRAVGRVRRGVRDGLFVEG